MTNVLMKKYTVGVLAVLAAAIAVVAGYVYWSWPETPDAYIRDVIEVPPSPDYFGNPTPRGGIVNPNQGKTKEENEPASPTLSFDDSDLREVAGFTDDVFVGRVVKMSDTRQVQGLVFTHYDIEVVSTLKGDLKGTVDVAQQGGVVAGKWFIYQEDDASAAELGDVPHKNHLGIGQIYRFSTLRNDKLGTNLLLPTKVGYALLSVDGRLGVDETQAAAAKTQEVKEMEDAVANEILPKHKLKKTE